MASLYDYRREYRQMKLDIVDLLLNPVEQFNKWFTEAEKAGIDEPNVMILSTTGNDLRPSSRIVLLKDCSDDGFTFFTNYTSKKGHQINENPYGALLFPWHTHERQVRIEGRIEKLPEEISDQYFLSRPEGSRLGAWTSPQSKEIPSRAFLDRKEEEFRTRFKDNVIPRPLDWGGYILKPDLFEFWQGRENRLHDRFEYLISGNEWKLRRLAP
jgi:pyridoxamine 5'-phosphate oxidase